MSQQGIVSIKPNGSRPEEAVAIVSMDIRYKIYGMTFQKSLKWCV